MKHQPIIITPLIRQHANDAGFYWQQIYDSKFSILQENEHIKRFYYLLYANLDGLRVAGNEGWIQAIDALKHWESQGGAYVAALLAHELNQPEPIAEVLDIVRTYPFATLTGYIAALGDVEYKKVQAHLEYLFTLDDPLSKCIAIEGSALHGITFPQEQIKSFLLDQAPEIKAAACRYIELQKDAQYNNMLLSLTQDDDLYVSYCAMKAISWLSSKEFSIAPFFVSLIQRYLDIAPDPGEHELIHYEQLEKLVRLAGLSCGFEHDKETAKQLNALLPNYLRVIFVAFYAEPSEINYLIDQLSDKKLAMLAFESIAILTALDIDESDYIDFSYDEDDEVFFSEERIWIDTRVRLLTNGIGMPNRYPLANDVLPFTKQSYSLLAGQPITIEHCQQLLQSNRQVIRYIAAWHLNKLQPSNIYFDITAYETL